MIEHPIIAALALLLIIEGITPFISPQAWRQLLSQLIQMSDKSLRIMGAVMMLTGAIIFKLIQS